MIKEQIAPCPEIMKTNPIYAARARHYFSILDWMDATNKRTHLDNSVAAALGIISTAIRMDSSHRVNLDQIREQIYRLENTIREELETTRRQAAAIQHRWNGDPTPATENALIEMIAGIHERLDRIEGKKVDGT